MTTLPEVKGWHYWKKSRKLHVFVPADGHYVSRCGRAAVAGEIRRYTLNFTPNNSCALCRRALLGDACGNFAYRKQVPA